jgi:hypothetical protein
VELVPIIAQHVLVTFQLLHCKLLSHANNVLQDTNLTAYQALVIKCAYLVNIMILCSHIVSLVLQDVLPATLIIVYVNKFARIVVPDSH